MTPKITLLPFLEHCDSLIDECVNICFAGEDSFYRARIEVLDDGRVQCSDLDYWFYINDKSELERIYIVKLEWN